MIERFETAYVPREKGPLNRYAHLERFPKTDICC